MTETEAPSPTDLTIRETASELNCSEKTVRNLIKRRDLTAIHYGRRFTRVPRDALDAYKAAHRRPALDPQTVEFLRELAAGAPPLTEEQRDVIRSAFRAPAQSGDRHTE